MGAELWTSPITGYRRRGTRLSELRNLLGSGITAHAILEPLQSCPNLASAIEMRNVLRRRDFDVAGVMETPEGPVIGFVKRSSLKNGTVHDYIQQLTINHVISEATPLSDVLGFLKCNPLAFVLIGPSIRGIVTRADLNKPPVRVYLFGLISLLEMHLTFWIRYSYGEDSWQGELREARLNLAKDLFEERKKRNQQVSLLECLQFCDKRDLILEEVDLRARLNIDSRRRATIQLNRVEDLRNRLAHSQLDLVEGTSWQQVIELVEWAEDFVNTSDHQVEKEASKSAVEGESQLWMTA